MLNWISKATLQVVIDRIGKHIAKKADKTEIPKKVSQLQNDSAYITNAVDNLVNYYKKTETYDKNTIDNLVKKVVSASIEYVEGELPETGDPNKIYLKTIPGAADNAKEEFIWLEKETRYEMIGSTRMREAQVFKGTKNSFGKADTAVISEYFAAHPSPAPAPGDIFVITTNVDGKPYEMSSYVRGKSDWEAITGHVDADKVILRNNIKLAGSYTQVGNITKGANEAKDLNVVGKSVKGMLDEIFTKKLQPTTPTQPSVSGFSLTGAKAVEVGTKVPTATFGTGVLNPGSYQYGPATGVKAKTWSVDRVAAPATFNKSGIAAAPNGTDDNAGKGFIIGDGEEENVVTSLAYKVTATYDEGAVAFDNVGGASEPPVKIAAGSKSQQTSAYTGFRKYFYGATTEKPSIDSAYVRGLTNSTSAYRAGNITIQVPKGATRVAIACIGTAKGVTKVINQTAMNADVTGTFKQSTVNVNGAENYTAKEYKIWVFEPALPYENPATLVVTLG